MATVTETLNGAQGAADESSRAALRTADALSEAYLATYDAGLRAQARGVELFKTLLDQGLAAGREQRKLVEELATANRRAQEALLEAAGANLSAAQKLWTPGR